jgi:uncharacterized protein YqeY
MGSDERFGEDLKSAMKSGDTLTVGVLRLLKTRLKEARIEKRGDLSDEEVYRIITSEMKKRREAIDLFEKGGRGDLASREHDEIKVLESYLPPKLSEDEIRALAREAIAEVDAQSSRDLGRVMKVLMPKVVGRSEGSLVNKIVRELLAESKE